MNIQPNTFESELREIAKALVRAGVDRDLGAPQGANVKTEAHVGIITVYWMRGKSFSVDTFIPAKSWEAAKVNGKQDQYIRSQIGGMRRELQKLKADHLWRAA